MYKWLLFVFLFALVGCNDQQILEDLGFSNTVSYDLHDEDDPENRLRVTISIPVISSDRNKEREIITTTAESSKEARIKLSTKTDRKLVSGQLRNSLYGESLAKLGLWNYIDTFVRDPTSGTNIRVVLIEGNAHKLLSKHYSDHPRTSDYIDEIIEKSVKNHITPESTLYTFARDYYDDGSDPVTPILKQKEETIEIVGVAIFKEDKYVSKIDIDKSIIFSFLRNSFQKGQFSIKFGEANKREVIVMSALLNDRKIKVVEKNKKILIEMEIQGVITEYIGDKTLSEEKDMQELQKQLAKKLEEESQIIIKQLQDYKADSLGIGRYIRNSLSYKEWSEMDWRETYSKLEIEPKVTVKIVNYGKFQ
ncbi:Ger(x)C family spore germination protein [Bacillus timonensis]|nr:Ger(x)C family spore germination protein [Bacillus timonensis]